MIRELAGEGRTALLSSHAFSEVQQVTHRVGIMRRGELVTGEPLSELFRRRDLRTGG